MTEHTPGPWQTKKVTLRATMDRGEATIWQVTRPHGLLHDYPHVSDDIREHYHVIADDIRCDADARLLALAPAMLDALKAWDEWVCSSPTDQGHRAAGRKVLIETRRIAAAAADIHAGYVVQPAA